MKIFSKIKGKIKKYIPMKILYDYKLYKLNKNKKKTFFEIESEINDQYKIKFNKSINWNDPKTYTEKLNVSKVYNPSKLKTELTDKITVRKWIEKKIGKEYLVPIIGIYKNFDEINFNELPSKFVIKCNHDSGSVTVVTDKKTIDMKKLKEKYDYYINQNFSLVGFEMHYKDIQPKIIVEEFLGYNINDYKFLCFDGKIYYCWIDFDRFDDHKRNMYDIKWNLQPFNQCNYANSNERIEKPKQFAEMLKIVEKLCKGFDHVRVDLYLINEKIYFGEMTFTNGNGFKPIVPSEYDLVLGKLWDLKYNKIDKKIKPFYDKE